MVGTDGPVFHGRTGLPPALQIQLCTNQIRRDDLGGGEFFRYSDLRFAIDSLHAVMPTPTCGQTSTELFLLDARLLASPLHPHHLHRPQATLCP